MADNQEPVADPLTKTAGATPEDQKANRPSSGKQPNQGANNKDREERIRMLKEKQYEERQRKLDELKQQALAAQKFREQKEEERKKRLEELRARDYDRRSQVEERKKQIWEAERDRREAILRKNQEREARIEAKRKNERSSILFAFGSSTPRMLEPGETASYWASRRATSITNVMALSMSAAPPLTRRSSERELEGSKKRATSAGGIERKSPLDEFDGGLGSSRRKKTDLTPTLPSPRESTGMGNSLSSSRSFKSKNSPGRAYSMSRLDVLSQPRRPLVQPVVKQTVQSRDMSRSMSNLANATTASMRQRNASRSMLTLAPRLNRTEKLRLKAREHPAAASSPEQQPSSPGMRSGEITPSRPMSSMSQHSVASNLSQASAHLRSRQPGTPRRPRPISIAVTGVSSSPGTLEKISKSTNAGGVEKPPLPKVHTAAKKAPVPKQETPKKPTDKVKSTKSSTTTTPKGSTPVQSPSVENVVHLGEERCESELNPVAVELSTIIVEEIKLPDKTTLTLLEERSVEFSVDQIELQMEDRDSEMNTSMSSKSRITTEEEAKAALAERRRLAREQAEREAELERQRVEAERLAEEERLRKEEEDQRRMEEEQLKLLEEAKKAEELRLQQAIEEAQKREEEERLRREEEAKLKLEKEEAERKAKEEAEKLRQEMEIRLKKEEEDRQARRKRVEAIMLRTRGKGSTSTTTPTKDGEECSDGSPPLDDKMTSSMMSESDKFLDSERNHSDANSVDCIVEAPHVNNKHNGHHNGSMDSVAENNVTNSLLDVSSEPVGQILDLPSGNGKITDPQLQTSFINFQEKNEPPTVNDLLS